MHDGHVGLGLDMRIDNPISSTFEHQRNVVVGCALLFFSPHYPFLCVSVFFLCLVS